MAIVFQDLAATEAEIAQLAMRGKTTKEIAVSLSRAVSTIDFRHNNIRATLGLLRDRNLRTYIRSIR